MPLVTGAHADPTIHSADRRLAFHRKLLIWSHTIAAVFAALSYLYRIDLGAPFWLASSGLSAMFLSGPVIFPYVLAGIHSWKVATAVRWRVYLYLSILVVGSVASDVFISGGFGSYWTMYLIEVLALQVLVYMWSAELLLDDI